MRQCHHVLSVNSCSMPAVVCTLFTKAPLTLTSLKLAQSYQHMIGFHSNVYTVYMNHLCLRYSTSKLEASRRHIAVCLPAVLRRTVGFEICFQSLYLDLGHCELTARRNAGLLCPAAPDRVLGCRHGESLARRFGSPSGPWDWNWVVESWHGKTSWPDLALELCWVKLHAGEVHPRVLKGVEGGVERCMISTQGRRLLVEDI